MKVTVEIDCTPQEARHFMGLPDVSKVNEAYVENITKAMKGVTSIDQLQDMAKQIAPVGQMGMKLFQQFMDNSSMFSAAKKKKEDD